MAKSKRRLVRLMLLLAVFVILPVALAPLLPLDSIKPQVESRLSGLLGRQTAIGSLRLSLITGPRLIIKNLVAREDPAFGDGNFLEAGEVRASFSILPFVLRREIAIDSLNIKSPSFTFTRNPEGVWSWATIGRNASAAPRATPAARAAFYLRPLVPAGIALTAMQSPTASSINSIHLEEASIRLVDRSGAQPPETLYRHVELRASVTPPQSDQPAASSHVIGEMRARSNGGDGSERLISDMPFDLVIERAESPGPTVRGSLGPGSFESKNLAAESFKSAIDLRGNLVALDQMDVSLYGGAMRGRMEVDLATRRFISEGEVENLNMDEAISSKIGIPGQLTGFINAQFKLGGQIGDFAQVIPTLEGGGRVASRDMFIGNLNVSEQVARALKVSSIGDMNSGTGIGSLEADFQISAGIVTTARLLIQQLDGLGDANAHQGLLKLSPPPTLSYAATVFLSSDATARAKSASPFLGAAISILEQNNRISVPLNITGDLRAPQVQVDVMGFLR